MEIIKTILAIPLIIAFLLFMLLWELYKALTLPFRCKHRDMDDNLYCHDCGKVILSKTF